MPFGNDIVGGKGSLIREMIKSPNFIHSVQGWTINKDGSAEFSNLVIRGTFSGIDFILNSAGFFFYNGTPAHGTLILAIADAAGTDQFGNQYSGPGIALSGPGGANSIQLRPDLGAVLVYA
ncbi:MAG TPA: hypothetical protein VKU39_11220 [Streptosporangiaceae bacterium]|nr:hypothetical protein [Streptosporangiaceae bacterium]